MDAPMNTRGVVGELRNTLDNAGRKFALALGFTGAKPEEINKTRRLGSSRILATLGALPKNVNQPKPAHAGVLGQSAENKGKTILDHLSSGLDRFLLSINICIVLLRAAGFDKTTVDPALAFVRELKVLYDALCSSVTPGDTNNAKVNSVKGALDALLAKPIPVGVMTALQAVVGPELLNDRGFDGYADEVKAAAAAVPVAPAVPAALAPAPANAGNLARAAQEAANNAAAAPLAPLRVPQPPVAPVLGAPLTPPAAVVAANPELIGVLTRDGRDITGVKYKLADNNGQPKLLDNFINYQDNSYFISKIKNTGLTNVTANTFYKVSKGSTNASYYLLNNTLNNNTTLYVYKLPKIKGGRRRTKAKAKASRKAKAKASRKTKAKATRRNRRS